jgi:CHAT domain-containing protein
MNKTKLVVISACETGQGELVSNEGVISLARAFAYAGCASSISSLWKADDQATSFILRRFYFYLEKGYKKSTALRRAKLDYLANGTVNKSPAYWSHLVLIGDTAPLYPRNIDSWWWGLLLIPVAVVSLWIVRKRKKSR